MARQQSDRNIPHLRDIFGFHSNWGSHNQQRQNEEYLQNKLSDMRLQNDKSNNSPSNYLAGNDSAICIDSTSEEEIPKTSSKKKKQRSRRDNSRTLTEKDVKHLERHLSMKKTIRKKIMRDLQQAFVEDPNEFHVENVSSDKLKSEINIQSLSFGTPSQKTGKNLSKESNFLDMLKVGNATNSSSATSGRFENDDEDSGHGSPTREFSNERIANYVEDDDQEVDDYEDVSSNKKSSFWRRFTMKGRNKR